MATATTSEPWLIQSRARWLSARSPVTELRAERLSEVVPALAEAERLAAAGHWLLGMISFEAGDAFAPVAGSMRAPGAMPLVWLRAFDQVDWLNAPPDAPEPTVGELRPTIEQAAYTAAFDRVRELIAAGDLYQLNLTFPLRGTFSGDGLGLARRLWRRSGAGYGAYLADERWSVASGSPELFFARQGDRMTCRPMKGTRPRGRWPEDDAALAEELGSSAKDRAENLMILDMVRNDLGRVARTGTVRVPERFTVERWPTVWQMTSTVVGQTDASLVDLLTALYPSASVTGAPKRRTLAAIAELEAEPREAYCGAIGYLAPGRRAQFNVAIRTAVLDRAHGTLRYDVGSGVVWDSTAASEWDECLVKARALSGASAPFELLETLRWRPDEGYFLLDGHLDRLRRSADHLGFAFDWDAAVAALASNASDWQEPCIARLTLAADGSLSVGQRPLGPLPTPLTARLATEPIDSAQPLLYHKNTARGLYDRAKATVDTDEVILHNERGEVTEFAIGNLVWQSAGRRYTPALACGLLPGVFRQHLLDAGQVREAVLRVADLPSVEQLWLVNSVREWVPVRLT